MARQIVVQIVGNASGFTKATEAASKAGSNLGGVLVNVAKIGAEALLAVTTAAAAFGVAAVEKTVASGQAAYEMSQKFGLLPGVASQWMSVASQMGISSDTIGAGFKFLDKNVGNMAITLQAGGKVAAATLTPYKDLGLDVYDTAGKIKSSNELMLEAADIFAKMPDGIEKTGLAIKLFGKQGMDMLPVLNLGKAGIEAYMAQGKALGDVMSTSQVEAAHKLFLAQAQIKTAMDGVTVQSAEFLMPAVTRMMDFITTTGIPAVQRFGSWFMEHLWPALQQVWAGTVKLWDALMHFLAPALDYIRAHGEQLKPLLFLLAIDAVITYVLIIGAAVLLVIAWVAVWVAITWVAVQVGNYFKYMGDSWLLFENTVIGGERRLIGALDHIPGVHIALPTLIGGGGTVTAGGHGGTQSFDSGGTVKGDYLGQRVMVQAQVGEHFSMGGRGAGRDIHVHVNDVVLIDGQDVDRLANQIVNAVRAARAA